MDNSDEVKFCSNCKKNIAARNFLMHEAHCSRNIVLCPECEEPVPRVALDEHKKEYHSKVTCEMCQMRLEKCNIESHKAAECPKRPIPCKYCELEKEFDKLDEHLEYCGSRTETCSTCQKNIMIKDQEDHDISGCEPPSVKSHDGLGDLSRMRNMSSPPPLGEERSSIVSLDSSFVRDEIARVTRSTGAAASLLTSFTRDGFPDFFSHGARDTSYASDEEMMLAYQLERLNDSHRHAPTNFHRRRNRLRAAPGPILDTQKTVLPCEFCGSPFNSNDLQIHQFSCRGELESSNDPDDHHIVSEFTNTVFPCEFCEVPYSEDKIAFHQAECPMNLEMTPRYLDHRDRDSYEPVEEMNVEPITNMLEPRWSPVENCDESDELNAEIECEFCQENFPIRLINEHEMACPQREDDLPVVAPSAAANEIHPTSRAVKATKTTFSNYHPGYKGSTLKNSTQSNIISNTTVKKVHKTSSSSDTSNIPTRRTNVNLRDTNKANSSAGATASASDRISSQPDEVARRVQQTKRLQKPAGTSSSTSGTSRPTGASHRSNLSQTRSNNTRPKQYSDSSNYKQ